MAKPTDNVASIAYDILSQLVDPPLKMYKEWGDLPKTAMGRMQQLNFMGDWDSFVEFLSSWVYTLLFFDVLQNYIVLQKPNWIWRAWCNFIWMRNC